MAARIRLRTGSVVDVKSCADSSEKLFRLHPVQIFDDAIVGKYLQLVFGKDHRQEEVVLLIPGVREASVARFSTRAACACSTVVSVGYVKKRHIAECADEAHGVRDAPDGVLDSVRRGEIVERV